MFSNYVVMVIEHGQFSRAMSFVYIYPRLSLSSLVVPNDKGIAFLEIGF